MDHGDWLVRMRDLYCIVLSHGFRRFAHVNDAVRRKRWGRGCNVWVWAGCWFNLLLLQFTRRWEKCQGIGIPPFCTMLCVYVCCGISLCAGGLDDDSSSYRPTSCYLSIYDVWYHEVGRYGLQHYPNRVLYTVHTLRWLVWCRNMYTDRCLKKVCMCVRLLDVRSRVINCAYRYHHLLHLIKSFIWISPWSLRTLHPVVWSLGFYLFLLECFLFGSSWGFYLSCRSLNRRESSRRSLWISDRLLHKIQIKYALFYYPAHVHVNTI